MPKSSGFYTESSFSVDNKFTEVTLLHASENGYSEVYKAIRHGKWHVLKRLTDQENGNSRYQQLLQKEFEIGYQLSHPGIVHTLGMEEVEGLGICIIQEYIDGVTWDECFTGNSVPSREKRRILAELCTAIDYIHQWQIVHRDLTPKNILITRDGHHPRILDFGLADRDVFVYLKEPAGTTVFASPEQQRPGILDNRSDIYSLGVLIEGICSPSDFRLKLVARKCLTNNPEKRYVSANDIIHKLEPIKWWRWVTVIMCLVACCVSLLWKNADSVQKNTIERLQLQSKEQQHEILRQRSEIAKQQAHFSQMKKQVGEMSSSLDSAQMQNKKLSERVNNEDRQAMALAEAKKELHQIANATYRRIWNKHTELANQPAKRKSTTAYEVYLVDWKPIVDRLVMKYNLDAYPDGKKMLMDEWYIALYDIGKQ